MATLLVCLSLVETGAGQARAGDAGSEVEAGIAALERGDAAAARAHFDAALRIDPKNAAAHTNLGLVADRAGDLEAASRHFAQAARIAPSALTHNNYGVILLRLGREREAAAQFEASLGADPRQPNALVNLAQIRFASGSPDDLKVASDLLERAFEIAPDVAVTLPSAARASGVSACSARCTAWCAPAPTDCRCARPTPFEPVSPNGSGPRRPQRRVAGHRCGCPWRRR